MLGHLFLMSFKNIAFAVGFLALCLSSSPAWAGKYYSSDDLYYLAQKSYYKLKKSTNKQRYRHHWEKVIKKFSKVVESYPKSRQAYKATFTIARLYQGLNAVSKNIKDLDQALYYYKKVYLDFSGGTLTDDALFESAEIYLGKKDLSSALRALKIILKNYHDGDKVVKARLKYQKMVSADLKIEKQKSPHSANTSTLVLSQEKKTSVTKQVVLSKKTKLLDRDEINQVLATKVKEKKKVTAQSNVPRRLPKINKRSTKDKVNVVSNIKSSSKLKEIFPKKEKKVKKGYLYTPSSKRGENTTALIVVDAGHGGKDQGAKSRSGIHEKKVNLTIARHVKAILLNRYKYKVVMTRKDDTFIPLKERTAIANNRNADLFVSIHANAAERKSAHGIETYFLGTTNNDRALETAARENGKLVQSVKDDQVQEILASLITTTKINDSSRLAGIVQENLFKSTRKKFRELKNLGVKEGPFYVLHGANMPSILVEVGFLTNQKESRMLSKPDYLYRLASSIAEGIHKFLQAKGPSI